MTPHRATAVALRRETLERSKAGFVADPDSIAIAANLNSQRALACAHGCYDCVAWCGVRRTTDWIVIPREERHDEFAQWVKYCEDDLAAFERSYEWVWDMRFQPDEPAPPATIETLLRVVPETEHALRGCIERVKHYGFSVGELRSTIHLALRADDFAYTPPLAELPEWQRSVVAIMAGEHRFTGKQS